MTPTPEPSPFIPGAEPWSAGGGPDGVLVLHGFTGNPQSMRGLAEAFAAAGFAVELPVLPGHGTRVEDMIPTRWEDWSSCAEQAYQELASRCGKVVVAGLSFGGALACWLAEHHPEIAGIVAINSYLETPAEGFREILRETARQGIAVAPGVGSDIAEPGKVEAAYTDTPIEAALSMFEGVDGIVARFGDITCPVLIFTAPQDHVAPPVGSDKLAAGVSGPVERVTLERSYHVATLDFDRELIETGAVEFARKVTAA